MRRTRLYIVMIAGALFIQAQGAFSCSFAQGHFYQVTQLRGRVVGMTNYWPLLGYRSYPSWLRHRVTREKLKLRLYKYGWPIRDRSQTPLVKTVITDKNGRFDLESTPVGHYTLVIDWPTINAVSFDVEINNRAAETALIEIDVSPVDPDCSGGHEFMIHSK